MLQLPDRRLQLILAFCQVPLHLVDTFIETAPDISQLHKLVTAMLYVFISTFVVSMLQSEQSGMLQVRQ